MMGAVDDDRLLDELASVLRRADPVPADVTLAARSALAWRRMDAELAELLHDSAVDPEPAGLRSGRGWRTLTFETPTGGTIELEVSAQRSTRSIVGQIVPPVAATIVIRSHGTETSISTDDLGRFGAGDLPPGPVSLRCELPGGAIETGWVTI